MAWRSSRCRGMARWILCDRMDDLLARCRGPRSPDVGVERGPGGVSSAAESAFVCSRVREPGTLVGLAPLNVSRHLGTPLRRLAFVGTGASTTSILLAPDAWGGEVGAAVLRQPGLNTRLRISADLQQLRPGFAPARGCTCLPVSAPEARLLSLSSQEPVPMLPCRTWQAFTASLQEDAVEPGDTMIGC